jgi:outer membrane immunogenic protein
MKPALLAITALSLTNVSAFAADMAVPINAPLAPPPFIWNSCYGGGQGGGGFGQKNLNDSAGVVSAISGFTSANLNTSGYMLGGQIGCDYQFAPHWVAGIEGAATGGSIGGNVGVATPGLPGDSATFKQTTDLLTSVTARVGYAWNDWLLYGKGGAAWASDRYSAFDTLGTYDFEGLETRFGWTAGAGLEWAFSDIWSVRLEYDYYGFGTRSVNFIDNVSGTVGPLDIRQNIQVVKLGFNLHVFGQPGAWPLGW